jgi:hypothetical protein
MSKPLLGEVVSVVYTIQMNMGLQDVEKGDLRHSQPGSSAGSD